MLNIEKLVERVEAWRVIPRDKTVVTSRGGEDQYFDLLSETMQWAAQFRVLGAASSVVAEEELEACTETFLKVLCPNERGLNDMGDVELAPRGEILLLNSVAKHLVGEAMPDRPDLVNGLEELVEGLNDLERFVIGLDLPQELKDVLVKLIKATKDAADAFLIHGPDDLASRLCHLMVTLQVVISDDLGEEDADVAQEEAEKFWAVAQRYVLLHIAPAVVGAVAAYPLGAIGS